MSMSDTKTFPVAASQTPVTTGQRPKTEPGGRSLVPRPVRRRCRPQAPSGGDPLLAFLIVWSAWVVLALGAVVLSGAASQSVKWRAAATDPAEEPEAPPTDADLELAGR